jgi:hypothetical protein
MKAQEGKRNPTGRYGVDQPFAPRAVKPQAVQELLEEIRGELTRDQVVISVVASVTTAFLERNLNAPIPVIRAMPNTPLNAHQIGAATMFALVHLLRSAVIRPLPAQSARPLQRGGTSLKVLYLYAQPAQL